MSLSQLYKNFELFFFNLKFAFFKLLIWDLSECQILTHCCHVRTVLCLQPFLRGFWSVSSRCPAGRALKSSGDAAFWHRSPTLSSNILLLIRLFSLKVLFLFFILFFFCKQCIDVFSKKIKKTTSVTVVYGMFSHKDGGFGKLQSCFQCLCISGVFLRPQHPFSFRWWQNTANTLLHPVFADQLEFVLEVNWVLYPPFEQTFVIIFHYIFSSSHV